MQPTWLLYWISDLSWGYAHHTRHLLYHPNTWEESPPVGLSFRYNVKFGKERGTKRAPGPPNFWNNKNKCVFNKRTIKVCVSCWRCQGTSAPSAAHLTVSLYLCSSRSNARGESRALQGHCDSSKNQSRVRDREEGVTGRNGREIVFPRWGVINIEMQIANWFFTKRKQKKLS